jgi:hypothetical protein
MTSTRPSKRRKTESKVSITPSPEYESKIPHDIAQNVTEFSDTSTLLSLGSVSKLQRELKNQIVKQQVKQFENALAEYLQTNENFEQWKLVERKQDEKLGPFLNRVIYLPIYKQFRKESRQMAQKAAIALVNIADANIQAELYNQYGHVNPDVALLSRTQNAHSFTMADESDQYGYMFFEAFEDSRNWPEFWSKASPQLARAIYQHYRFQYGFQDHILREFLPQVYVYLKKEPPLSKEELQHLQEKYPKYFKSHRTQGAPGS